jgi:MFS transporter, DHA3 family, macrolide efflux protein
MSATDPGGASPFSRRVAAFLVGEALSAIGSWATIIAVWVYAAYQYDASAGDVALFGLAFVLPGIVLGPVAGLVVDRIGPRSTLAAAKVVGVAASLALLRAHDFRTLALLSAFHGASMAFSLPALQSMPPRLVAEQHLARTNALVSLTDEVAIVLGPAAGAGAIALFGFQGAFVFDALTYALGLAILPLVHLRPAAAPAEGDDATPPAGLRAALAGWRLIARTGILRRTVTCTFAVHLLYGMALLCEPLYVRDVLGSSEGVFAALQSAFGVFLVAGGLIAARLGDRIASFGWVVLGVGASGVTAIVYLGTPWVVVAFLGVALWGVATAVISGPSRTLLQRSSPERTHGRVLAADLVAGSTAELAGVGLAGGLVSLFGVPWSILGAGTAVILAALALAAGDRRDRAPAAPSWSAETDGQLVA